MRFAVAQLRKFNMPFTAEEDIDLTEDLNGCEDIVTIDSCHVKATFYERGDEAYSVNFTIDCKLTLEDSVTLKPVPYEIHTESLEVFSNDETLEEAFEIDGQTLDVKEAVIANILMSKPMSFTLEDIENASSIEEEEEVEEEEYINPAFASLKDLL